MQNFDINLENLTEQKREQLLSLIKEANNPTPKSLWKPEYKERYYLISGDEADNSSGTRSYSWVNDEIDNLNHSIGNVFKTEEDAVFAIERLKVIAELRRYADEHNKPINWSSRTPKYCLCYHHRADEIAVMPTLSLECSFVYFSSEEIAQKAIEAISEDRLKKYLFGVK